MKNQINVQLIKNFMETNNLSATKFCKLCQISPITFKKIMVNDLRFHISALFKISRILKVQVHELFY